MMTLISQLGNLEAAGLVRVARVEPDLEYLFQHTLVQEAAYASVLESDRKQLHRAVGKAIELLYPDRLDDYAAVLARHFEKAGEDQHALIYFIRAADAALASYANREAEMHFRRALELSCPQCEYAPLLAGLGESLYRQTRFDEARKAWREGLELYRSEKDSDGMARMFSRLARLSWHMGDAPGSLKICQEGMAELEDAYESADKAMLVHETARAYYFNDQTDKAFPLCKQALEMAETFRALQVQADTLATLGVLPELSPDDALEALQKSIEIARKHGLLEIVTRAYHNLGTMTHLYTQDMQLAKHYLYKAADTGRQRGVVTEELYSLATAISFELEMGNLQAVEDVLKRIDTLKGSITNTNVAKEGVTEFQASLLWMRGQWKEAEDLARSEYHQAIKSGNLQLEFAMASTIANILLELYRYGEFQDLGEVEAILNEIVAISEKLNKEKRFPHLQMAVLRARQGRFEESEAMLGQACEFQDEYHSIWGGTEIDQTKAEMAHRAGRYEEAMSLYEKVVGVYKKAGNRWSQARNMMDWAEVCAETGDPSNLEQARDLLRETLIIFDEIGARRHKKLIEERLQALRQRITAQAATYQRDAQELARAAQVQGSFLPSQNPQISGWDLSVRLIPARQTSGDYYDFIPLPDGRLGLLVADVADKGAAAALFMASSRSLIRTYAGEFLDSPEMVISAASRRLLMDTHAGLFVTVFYGVLDPRSGALTYCNAGHTPSIYLSVDGESRTLARTGPPLGVFDDAAWERGQIQLMPGDAVVLYTDGVTEAQNKDGKFFGEKGLLAALEKNSAGSAEQIRDAVLAEIHTFVGKEPQFDDITLMVLTREDETAA